VPPRVAGGGARPRLLIGFSHVLVPLLRPIIKEGLGRNERTWRKLQAIRDRLVVGSPLPVGLEAPARLAPCLGERHDLGVHNKVIWGGTPQLTRKGVVTEDRKRLHPGVRAGS